MKFKIKKYKWLLLFEILLLISFFFQAQTLKGFQIDSMVQQETSLDINLLSEKEWFNETILITSETIDSLVSKGICTFSEDEYLFENQTFISNHSTPTFLINNFDAKIKIISCLFVGLDIFHPSYNSVIKISNSSNIGIISSIFGECDNAIFGENISNCYISDCEFQNVKNPVDLNRSDRIFINDCLILNSSIAFQLASTTSVEIDNIECSNSRDYNKYYWRSEIQEYSETTVFSISNSSNIWLNQIFIENYYGSCNLRNSDYIFLSNMKFTNSREAFLSFFNTNHSKISDSSFVSIFYQHYQTSISHSKNITFSMNNFVNFDAIFSIYASDDILVTQNNFISGDRIFHNIDTDGSIYFTDNRLHYCEGNSFPPNLSKESNNIVFNTRLLGLLTAVLLVIGSWIQSHMNFKNQKKKISLLNQVKAEQNIGQNSIRVLQHNLVYSYDSFLNKIKIFLVIIFLDVWLTTQYSPYSYSNMRRLVEILRFENIGEGIQQNISFMHLSTSLYYMGLIFLISLSIIKKTERIEQIFPFSKTFQRKSNIFQLIYYIGIGGIFLLIHLTLSNQVRWWISFYSAIFFIGLASIFIILWGLIILIKKQINY